MQVRALLLVGLLFAAPAHAQTLVPAPAVPAEPAEGTPAPEGEAPAPESPVPEPPPTVATVHVLVENVESASGRVWLALCDSGLSVEGCPYKLSVAAQQGFVEATFTDIPPGEYAVVGYHDVNNNGVFDMILKVPREPYALSGAAAEELVPRFGDAALPLRAGPNDVIIRMKRLGG